MRRTFEQKGFTLMEAVVAAALFGSLMVIIIGVYLFAFRINTRTDLVRSADENARFILEFMSKEIKNGKIIYTADGPAPCNQAYSDSSVRDYYIVIKNIDGDNECFYSGNSDGASIVPTDIRTDSPRGQYLWLKKNNLQQAEQLNASNVLMDFFKIYINPSNERQFESKQPSVTLAFRFHATDSRDTIVIPIETTISIPRYDLP